MRHAPVSATLTSSAVNMRRSAMQAKDIVRRFVDEYQSGGSETAFAELLDANVIDPSGTQSATAVLDKISGAGLIHSYLSIV